MLFGKCGDLRLDARELLLSVGQFRDQRQQNAQRHFGDPFGVKRVTMCHVVQLIDG
jgi:hypothetical protein